MNQDAETAGENFDASLAVTEDFSHGTQPAPDMMRSKLSRWGQMPDAAKWVKTYDIHGERYTGVLGPRGRSDLQLIHLRSPAVGDTFDVSFAVPNDFSHRTQLAPDMMLSELGKWDFLPNAECPFINYEIGGERYTAVLGPRGSNDVQLIHHPRFASRSDAALVTPTAPRIPTASHLGLIGPPGSNCRPQTSNCRPPRPSRAITRSRKCLNSESCSATTGGTARKKLRLS